VSPSVVRTRRACCRSSARSLSPILVARER
jgi:hypothetical protein